MFRLALDYQIIRKRNDFPLKYCLNDARLLFFSVASFTFFYFFFNSNHFYSFLELFLFDPLKRLFLFHFLLFIYQIYIEKIADYFNDCMRERERDEEMNETLHQTDNHWKLTRQSLTKITEEKIHILLDLSVRNVYLCWLWTVHDNNNDDDDNYVLD